MPTAIGVASVALALFCFLKKPAWLFGLLILASMFEASSAFNSGGRGIQPYYVIAPFMILRAFLDRKQLVDGAQSFNGRRLLLFFAVLSVGSALVLPIRFAGVPVYSPSLGLEDGFSIRPPLNISQSNYAQAVFLILQVMVVWAAAVLSPFAGTTRRFYLVAFYLLTSVIFVQLVCRVVGIEFPYALLENNPGYYMEDSSTDLRPPGTFAEPSLAGLALTMFFMGFLEQYLAGRGSRWRVFFALAAIGVVSSSSSLIAAALIGTARLLFPPRPDALTPKAHRKLPKIIFTAGVAAVLLLSPFKDTLISQTIEKSNSDSFVKRLTADIYAIDLAAATDWIGVGLGSNRPSSLFTSLLSNLGAVGTASFFLLIGRVLSNARGDLRWIMWAGIAVLTDMMVGVPDITTVSLWIVMALAVHFRASRAGSLNSPVAESLGTPISLLPEKTQLAPAETGS